MFKMVKLLSKIFVFGPGTIGYYLDYYLFLNHVISRHNMTHLPFLLYKSVHSVDFNHTCNFIFEDASVICGKAKFFNG